METFNKQVEPRKPYNTKPVSAAIKRLIKARWAEGMREDDFRRVYEIMQDHWAEDDKLSGYLRPHTLFTGKMESYLRMPGRGGDSREEMLRRLNDESQPSD